MSVLKFTFSFKITCNTNDLLFVATAFYFPQQIQLNCSDVRHCFQSVNTEYVLSVGLFVLYQCVFDSQCLYFVLYQSAWLSHSLTNHLFIHQSSSMEQFVENPLLFSCLLIYFSNCYGRFGSQCSSSFNYPNHEGKPKKVSYVISVIEKKRKASLNTKLLSSISNVSVDYISLSPALCHSKFCVLYLTLVCAIVISTGQ